MPPLHSAKLIGKSMKLPLALMFAVPLAAACGGTDTSPSPTVSLSTNHIAVSATTSDPAPTESVQFVFANPPNPPATGSSLTLQVSVQAGSTGVSATPSAINTTTGLPESFSVILQSPASLGPGVYESTFTFNVCMDQTCNSKLTTIPSPLVLTVQYTVT